MTTKPSANNGLQSSSNGELVVVAETRQFPEGRRSMLAIEQPDDPKRVRTFSQNCSAAWALWLVAWYKVEFMGSTECR
jgi:hypothetical protein